MNYYTKFLLLPLFCLSIAGVGGCGGGTSGTGLSSYEGEIRKVDGTPAAGVTVTLVETKDSTITDPQGAFLLQSDTLDSPGTLKIQGVGIESTVKLKTSPKENEKVRVDIQLEQRDVDTTISELSLSAEIIGSCDLYFENREYIRQGSRVPEGTVCVLRAKVSGDGKPQSLIRVAIQTRACEPGAPWRPVESELTEPGLHAGVAKISFHFYSSKEDCQYRVVAPYNDPNYKNVVVFPFLTFAELEKK